MNVYQTTLMFKQFCNEAQSSWFDRDSFVPTTMADGYNQFRALVAGFTNAPYQISADIVFPTVTRYDLALAGNPVRILGKTPTQASLERLLTVWVLNTSNNLPMAQLVAFKSQEDLLDNLPSYGGQVVTNPGGYYFGGTVIELNTLFAGTLRLYYVPKSIVDWTKNASTDNEFIDDFENFHDLIALFAYRKYAIRDGAPNQPLEMELRDRIMAFKKFMNQGRDFGAQASIAQTKGGW